MKLNVSLSWLMGTVQQSLFPYLDESLTDPLTEPEKRLVKILELVQVEKYVPVSARRQWLGRPIKEREAIARAFVAKALLRYQHTSSLRNALLSTPNLRMLCGLGKRHEVPSESTFSRAFAEYAKAGLRTVVHDALAQGVSRFGTDRSHQPGFDGHRWPGEAGKEGQTVQGCEKTGAPGEGGGQVFSGTEAA